MFRENQIGYWLEYHRQPGRLGEGERYTLVQPIEQLGMIEIGGLSARHLAEYRDRRLSEVKTETVRRELRSIRRALTIARNELDVPLPSIRDLYERVRMPEMSPHRDRRLSPDEEAALFFAADTQMRMAMVLALETAMRRREMCCVTPAMVDLGRGVIHLPREVTKVKRGRAVPLSPRAIEATGAAMAAGHETVIGLTTNGLNKAWQKTRRRAAREVPSVATFRWHDFRHECLSRLAQAGWTALEIQAVSGHSTPAMLSRYVNMQPDTLVNKLRGMSDAQSNQRDQGGARDDAG